MFPGLYNIVYTEYPGGESELRFLYEAGWLLNSEVRHHIEYNKGRWHVSMILIWAKNPYRFLRRKIDHYDTEKKAAIYAELFKRTMQKDERGTIKINDDDFNICFN
jgi:hypothetical protein